MSSCGLWVSVQLDSFYITHTHTMLTDKGNTERKLFVPLHVCMVSGSLGKNICDFLQGHFPARQDFFPPFFENKLVYIRIWVQRKRQRYRMWPNSCIIQKERDFLSQCDDTGINIHGVIQHKRGWEEKGKRNRKGKAVTLNVIWGFLLSSCDAQQ